MKGSVELRSDILVINLPADETVALDFLLAQNGHTKVKIIGQMKDWHFKLNEWIRENEIVFLDLYELSEMIEWGNPRIYEGFPGGGIYSCDTLEEVILPKNLKGLGIKYFEDCDALHTIHFPANFEYMEGDFGSLGLSETGLKKIHIELTEKNSWILSDYYDLDIKYTIKSDQYIQVDGVLIDIKNQELVKFPKEFRENYEISADIVSIADYAFFQSKVKQVIVPGTVKKLGYSVFRESEIHTLIFGEGIQALNDHTFYKAKVSNLVLCDTLKDLGAGTFKGINLDGEITFGGNSSLWEIDAGLIYHKTDKSVVGFIPNDDGRYIVRDGTKIIGKDAFAFPLNWANIHSGIPENILSISLPDSLKVIEDYAFRNCPIVKITFPEELESIGEEAFSHTYIPKVLIPNSVTTIKRDAFSHCPSLQYARLSNSLNEISSGLFSFCDSLEEVHLPDEVRLIGSFTFGRCKKLTRINLPAGLKEIGSEAFRECESLEAVFFSETLEKIEYKAFEKCISLKEAILPGSLNYLGYHSFLNCSALESVYIPDACEIESPGDWGFQFEGCKSLSNLHLTENNLYYTFLDGFLCNKNGDFLIKSFLNDNIVEIPDRVRIIGSKAFANTSCCVVIMPDSITEIRSMAFRNCKELTHIHFSRNVEIIKVEKFWEEDLYSGGSIGPFGGLFDECVKLKKITNVPIEIEQKYAEVFSVAPEVITVENKKVKKKEAEIVTPIRPVIPEQVLEAISSKYFTNPNEVNRLLGHILIYQNEELVVIGQSYLNNVRKLLEIVRNQLQQLGIIPKRCSALNTGLRILRGDWPNEVVPDVIKKNIVNVLEITNKASHADNARQKQFDNYGYTNKNIVEFCLFLVKYIEYITDYCVIKKYDRQRFEREFEAVIYSSFKPDITLFSTTGIVRSWQKHDPRTEEIKKTIEVLDQNKCWHKVKLYENVLVDFYKKKRIVVEEDQTIRVKILEKINHQNNPYWIAKEIVEVIKKAPLFVIK